MSMKTRFLIVGTMFFSILILSLFLFAYTPRESYAALVQSETSSQSTVTFTGTLSVKENVAFTSTGNFDPGRFAHTAIKLSDGKVLITGGRLGNSSSGSKLADLYDPALQTSISIDDMLDARRDHTASLLPNGDVLIAGGYATNSVLASTELYILASGTFTYTGNMAETRYQHEAVRLLDGDVLLVGGRVGNGLHRSTEIYHPDTGTFTPAGDLNYERVGHTATLLSDGRVLVAGGSSTGSSSNLVEIYDPNAGHFSVAASMHTPRSRHSATLLSDGKVLIVGGISGSSWTTSAEIYDPDKDEFTQTGSLRTARGAHAAILLSSGNVLVTGGSINGGITNSCEIYNPEDGAFYLVSSLVAARRNHTITKLNNGNLVVIGGYDVGLDSDRDAELGVPAPSNDFSGYLTLPFGWINSDETSISFFATTSGAPLDSCSLSNDGETWSGWTEPATEYLWDLGGDGSTKPVYLRVRDTNGQVATAVTGTVDVDTVPPSSSMASLPERSSVKIPLAWSGYDNLSGIAGYDLQVRSGENGTWTSLLVDSLDTESKFTGDSGNTYYFRVRAKDEAGNLEAWPTTYDAVTLAYNTFTGTLVLPIGWTNSSTEEISFSGTTASAPLEAGALSNDGVNWGPWIPASNGQIVRTSWKFGDEGANKPVFLKLRDTNGQSAVAASGAVNLDTTPPSSEMSNLPAAISKSEIPLSWSGNDNLCGIAFYELQVRAKGKTDWAPIIENTTETNATYRGVHGETYEFRIRATDEAGNTEEWSKSTGTQTMVDTQVPIGSVTIEAIDESDIHIFLNAFDPDTSSGISGMRVNLANRFDTAIWEPYTQRKTIPRGGLPIEKIFVHAQFRDGAGNLSIVYSYPERDVYLPHIAR